MSRRLAETRSMRLTENWRIGSRARQRVIMGLSVLAIFFLVCSLSVAFVPGVGAAEIESIIVDGNSIKATNYLSLGFQLDGYDIASFATRSTLQNLAEDAHFRMVRFFHHRYGWAVTNWNDETKTGSWNWNNYDRLVNAVRGIGAEPLICLGYGGSGSMSIPSGMDRWDVDSFFPDPHQFAAFAREWVRHFKGTVKYWEILNEPYQHYFWTDSTKLARYCTFWNIVASEMRKEDPTICISHDGSTAKNALNYWKTHGDPLDFLGFHKYESSSRNPATDSELFARAESERLTDYGGSDSNWRNYGIQDARELYGNIPVICGEANINWVYHPSTDSRIQTMTAAVWATLTIRYQSLAGLNYWLWWNLAGKSGSGENFGMINKDNNEPYYSYYALKMFASNSEVGDIIVESSSTSSDIRTHAWHHGDTLNLLVIHKGTGAKTVKLSGLTGTFKYQRLDDQHIPPQIGTIDAENTISLNGYTVMLLQQVSTQPPQSPEQNMNPIASISAPNQATVDSSVTFNAESSYDPDGTIKDYRWDFGDDTTGHGETVTHTYASTGTYTVTLTVIDNNDSASTTEYEITVTSSPEDGTSSYRRSSSRDRRHRTPRR